MRASLALHTKHLAEKIVANYKIKAVLCFEILIFCLILYNLFATSLGVYLFAPYYWVADQDLILVTQALIFNSGLEQGYFDHPGYLLILLLSWWFKFGHLLGFIPISSHDELIALPSFSAGLEPLEHWTRIFSLLFGTAFLLLFGTAMRLLFTSRLIALVCTYVLSAGMGMGLGVCLLRTELSSLLFAYLGIFLLMKVVSSNTKSSVLFVFLSGTTIYAALLIKIHVVFLLAFVPIFLVFFSRYSVGARFKYQDICARIPLFVIALLSTYLFIGEDYFDSWVAWRWYQVAALFGIVTAAVLVAIKMRCTVYHAFAGCLIWLQGFILAFVLNYLHYNSENHRSILYFLDKMWVFCGSDRCKQGDLSTYLSNAISDSISSKLDLHYTLYQYPWNFVYWLVILLLLTGIRRWRRLEWTAASMTCAAFVIEWAQRLRWPDSRGPDYVSYYYLFSESLMALALAMVLLQTRRHNKRWTQLALILVVSGASLWSSVIITRRIQYNSISALSLQQDVENWCKYAPYTHQFYQILKERGGCERVLNAEIAGLK